MRYGRNGRNGGGNGKREYDNRGRIALWENTRSDHPQAPQLTGTYTDHDGITWNVSVWEEANPRENGPVLRGTISPREAPRDTGGGRRRAPMQGARGYAQRRNAPPQQRDFGNGPDPDLNDDISDIPFDTKPPY